MSENARRHPRASGSKEAPPYAIRSVDNALRLAAALQTEGSMTVTEAARRLDVAASTAHRLLGMLVYRDFATHEGHGIYRCGPLLDGHDANTTAVARLREIAGPHLEALAGTIDETCNLEIRVADHSRFIASAEGTQTIRVSSREGMSFPLHRTSGGLVLLAAMTPAQMATLYDPARFHQREHERPDLEALAAELVGVRDNGMAVNLGRSESSVAAIAMPIRNTDDQVVAAVAISMPATRFNPRRVASLRGPLARAARDIHTDLLIAG